MATTRATLASIFASIAILVVGWQAGSVVVSQQPTYSHPTGSSDRTTATSRPTRDAATTGQSAKSTFTGDSVNTRFGAVQVQVTVSAGSIADVAAVHLTDRDRKSVSISNRAAPILRDEVLSSQSVSVSQVSGATYTSEAYLASLQSALDLAGI